MSGRGTESNTVSLDFTHFLDCFDPVLGRVFKGAWVAICISLQTLTLPQEMFLTSKQSVCLNSFPSYT